MYTVKAVIVARADGGRRFITLSSMASMTRSFEAGGRASKRRNRREMSCKSSRRSLENSSECLRQEISRIIKDSSTEKQENINNKEIEICTNLICPSTPEDLLSIATQYLKSCDCTNTG